MNHFNQFLGRSTLTQLLCFEENPSKKKNGGGEGEKRKHTPIIIETRERKVAIGNEKFKYIGESNRSGYERGVEHYKQFMRLDKRSHILKHYLKYHKNIPKEKLVVGMRIRASFKSAIERQISEAVAIAREEDSVTELMNSKAEYNRCKLPRLTAKTFEEQEKEVEATKEEEREIKSEIRNLKLRSREEKEKKRYRYRKKKRA